MPKSVKAILEEARQHDDYWQHWIVSDFTEELCRRMAVLKMTRRAFADKIHSTPAYVSKVLGGEENLTVRSMAKLARAVGSLVRVHLAPVGTYTTFIDFPSDTSQSPTYNPAGAAAFDASPTNPDIVVHPQSLVMAGANRS